MLSGQSSAHSASTSTLNRRVMALLEQIAVNWLSVVAIYVLGLGVYFLFKNIRKT